MPEAGAARAATRGCALRAVGGCARGGAVPETWRLFHRHASSQWSDRGHLARQGKPASSELDLEEALRREFARTPPLIRY